MPLIPCWRSDRLPQRHSEGRQQRQAGLRTVLLLEDTLDLGHVEVFGEEPVGQQVLQVL